MIYDIAKKAEFLFNQIAYCNESMYASSIASQMRNAIREQLIDYKTMTVAGACQTSQAVAIETGVFNENETAAARKRLVEIIHRDGDVNSCGVIGLRYILHALTNAGEGELAYKLVTSNSRSCYGYWIEHGATSLWESFMAEGETGDNSQNHHFLGDISSWFIQDLAGIKPNPGCDDISYFEISPVFVSSLASAKGQYLTQNGYLKVAWVRIDENIKLDVILPPKTHGKILLKNGMRADGKSEWCWSSSHKEKSWSFIISKH